MALPCVCYRCARCLSLASLKDPECLSTEKQNCKDRSCSSCTFTCSRYTESMDFSRGDKILQFQKDDLINPL